MVRGASGKLVTEASAVVRIIEASPPAAAMEQALAAADLVPAPELLLTEVVSALWRLQRAGKLEAATLRHRLDRAAALVDHIELIAPCWPSPWPLPLTSMTPSTIALISCCLAAKRRAGFIADQRIHELLARVLP